MARTLQRLNALAISRATEPGYLPDGGGLYLQITPAGRKSWVYRFTIAGRRRDMGLGPYPAVSLSDARTAATLARAAVKAGHDPIAEREAKRQQAKIASGRSIPFDKAAEEFISDHEGTWRNEKHRQQWRNTLETYASPTIGTLPVWNIGPPHIIRILQPIWKKKPETASRVRGRIERVLDWCKVRGYREGENPARWRGHLDKVFPAPTRVRGVKHHAAIAIDDMAGVYSKLAEHEGISFLAARFTILTAARAGETAGAKRAEFDLGTAVWTIPGERMKMGRPHTVPLSREALAIVRELLEHHDDDRVFPGQRKGRPLSIAAIAKALKTVAGDDVTTHGCRSTFKDWASERTNFASEVSEMALAHAIGDKIEAAYRRGTLMKKRAALMQAWAAFATAPHKDTNVVAMSRAAA